MTLNVQIKKDNTKNTQKMLNEFSRAMFNTGIVKHLKMNKRYFTRNKSALQKKLSKLKKIFKAEQIQQDIKDGKITVDSRGKIMR